MGAAGHVPRKRVAVESAIFHRGADSCWFDIVARGADGVVSLRLDGPNSRSRGRHLAFDLVLGDCTRPMLNALQDGADAVYLFGDRLIEIFVLPGGPRICGVCRHGQLDEIGDEQ